MYTNNEYIKNSKFIRNRIFAILLYKVKELQNIIISNIFYKLKQNSILNKKKIICHSQDEICNFFFYQKVICLHENEKDDIVNLVDSILSTTKYGPIFRVDFFYLKLIQDVYQRNIGFVKEYQNGRYEFKTVFLFFLFKGGKASIFSGL
jgi:hypothetical protein